MKAKHMRAYSFTLTYNPPHITYTHVHVQTIHALTHCCQIPIRQRAILFLEIYGNTLVQDRTARYIAKAGADLVRLVCDQSSPLSDLVDLSNLKYRDRDSLENAFKSWSVR